MQAQKTLAFQDITHLKFSKTEHFTHFNTLSTKASWKRTLLIKVHYFSEHH